MAGTSTGSHQLAELDLTQWDMMSLAFLTAIVAGTVRGTTGFGGPAIMMLVLTQFYSPASVLVLVLMADYLANIQLAIGALRHAAWRFLTPLLIATLIGLPFGVYLLQMTEPLILKKSIAAVTGVCALLMLTGWRFRATPGLAAIITVGIVGGAVVGATFIALPIMIFIFCAPGAALVSRATALSWGVVSATVLVAAYAYVGLLSITNLWQALVITVAYMFGAHVGSRVFKKLSESMFRRVVLFCLLGLSVIGIST